MAKMDGTKLNTALTFEELAKCERGHTFVDRFDEGIRFLIKRGGASLTAYVGVPESHPLAGFDYDSIPLEAHGGLTFSDKGDGKYFPSGFWWYGWDYAHCNDVAFYDLDPQFAREKNDDKQWTVEMVESDAWHTIYEFKKLTQLAEKIAAKSKAGEIANA